MAVVMQRPSRGSPGQAAEFYSKLTQKIEKHNAIRNCWYSALLYGILRDNSITACSWIRLRAIRTKIELVRTAPAGGDG